MSIRSLPTFSFLFLFSLAVCAQQVSLARLEMETTAYVPDGSTTPVFSTGGVIAGRFLPAHWIRLRVAASFSIADTAEFFYGLDKDTDSGSVLFNGADITFPSLNGSTWSLILFTGLLDDPASDSLLREFLKTRMDSPEFHGLPSGMVFSPESEIRGTGAGLAGVPGNAQVATGFYWYWNDHTGSDAAGSFDARIGIAGSVLVATIFGGATIQADGSEAVFRTGIASCAKPGDSYELYAEAGLRQFDTGSRDLGKNMYLLFEPRLYLDNSEIALSFFSSPVFPENAPPHIAVEAESNYIGLNVLFALGDIDVKKWRGGISFLASMDPEDPGTLTPFAFTISPFYTIRLSDYTLDVTAVLKPLHLDDINEAGEIRFLFKAVY